MRTREAETGPALPPRMLLKKDAAAYLGVSAQMFDRDVKVRPVSYGESGSIKRYDREDLDAWVDRQKGGPRVKTADEWLAGFDNDGGENARP